MEDLAKRTLGRTGEEVTTLGYGAMELRGAARGRELSDEDAGRMLNAVLDAGITLIDTSIDYGVAEERIGKYISHRRNEYFLASKCGCQVGAAPTDPNQRGGTPHIFTRENVIAGVEQSLRRMNTDHLDLVQLHASPSKEVLEENETILAMQDLQSQGKVRFLGMSGTIPNLADHIAMGVFDVFQIPYSCVQREHEELIARASAAGAGILVRGGAARGAPSDSERARDRNPELLSTWDKAGLDDLLDGASPMEFVMRFTGTHPGMTTNIVGTVSPDHLAGNVAAVSKGPLPDDVYAEAKRRLTAAGSAPKA
jgi:aryl-alcohol dehydrogenase-like predicted oxidoreductase